MKNKHLSKYGLLCLLFLFGLGACEQNTFGFGESAKVSKFTEVPKDISGTWRIMQVTRNGTNITQSMDFSRFRIRFGGDNTYTIDNYLPFLVKANGSWKLDDPQYPFNLEFKEETSGESLVSAFNYPVVNGKRQIALSFSPGCSNNIYTYVFEQE